MVSLIRQADGQFVNQTIPVVGRKDTVEGSFSNLNFSEPYLFTATAVRRDLMTPLGRAVSGIIPALTFNDISDNSNISQSTIPNVATATSKVPTTSLLPTIVSSSLKSSSLSATSSASITRSVSSIAGRSTSLTSSVIQSSSSISIIQSTMSTTVKESTLLTGMLYLVYCKYLGLKETNFFKLCSRDKMNPSHCDISYKRVHYYFMQSFDMHTYISVHMTVLQIFIISLILFAHQLSIGISNN